MPFNPVRDNLCKTPSHKCLRRCEVGQLMILKKKVRKIFVVDVKFSGFYSDRETFKAVVPDGFIVGYQRIAAC